MGECIMPWIKSGGANRQIATGTYNNPSSSSTDNFTISGINFKPTEIYIFQDKSTPYFAASSDVITIVYNENLNLNYLVCVDGSQKIDTYTDVTVTPNSDGFYVKTNHTDSLFYSSPIFRWIAVE